MSPPAAGLTAVQFEIMQVVWNAPAGATVAEIWEAISEGREVARTTVLNLVARLDERGWLKRRKSQGVYRYVATLDRDTATANAASRFVDDFFGGSASELVLSLLGSQRLSPAELDELKKLVEQANKQSRKS
jgi:BlaI family transcriptional regulator, penicillinase repressor